jgi:hypothetical protein
MLRRWRSKEVFSQKKNVILRINRTQKILNITVENERSERNKNIAAEKARNKMKSKLATNFFRK